MREIDVETNTGRISRWDAVIECIRNLLVDQNKNNQDTPTAAALLVSVLIFNDSAKTLLERMPLVGNGQKVFEALTTAWKMHKPRGGTGFSAGFECAKHLAENKGSDANMPNTNVMVVFLSDGRPGDLIPKPPANHETPMQETFRSHGKTYDAAGVHIKAMQKEHGDRLNLQIVCIHKDGQTWLKYLAKRFNGTFHAPELSLEVNVEESGVNRVDVPALASSSSSGDEEDEILDMGVKGATTLWKESYKRAKATGNAYTLMGTTTSSTSMRATFQSISSAATAMRVGGKLQERSGVVVLPSSEMKEFEATRMVLNMDKISLAPGEKSNNRKVRLAVQPFSQGGLRNVYRMRETGEPDLVAKESRHNIKYHERLKFHLETTKNQARASEYAEIFNKKLTSKQVGIRFLKAEVYRIKDETYPGGFRYLAVEEEMKGSKYEKWNSNNSYVHASDSEFCRVAQAFSHFTFEHSQEVEMVVDIQGCGFVYTDPQLHSKEKQYGRADRGNSGFQDFFRTHKCNSHCKHLGLKNRSPSSCGSQQEP